MKYHYLEYIRLYKPLCKESLQHNPQWRGSQQAPAKEKKDMVNIFNSSGNVNWNTLEISLPLY